MDTGASDHDRAVSLHQSSIVIDGCSFFSTGWHERLRISGVTALQMGAALPWDNTRGVIRRYEEYYRLVREDSRLGIVTTTDDIRTFKKEGRVGFILGAQRPYLLENDLGLIEVFHKLGARFLQIAYSERSLLADGCYEPSNAGLSQFGRDAIREMNRVGIQVDLSHVGERSSLEAITHSERPCIFSHSNPKNRANHPRNITDEQIKLCAEAGGVIGLVSFGPITWTGGEAPPTLDDFLNHVEYVVDLVGVDHVSFGTDSEATPGAYPPELRHMHATAHPEINAKYRAAHPNAKGTEGIATMEDLPNVTAGLLDRGWKDGDIQKFLGENLLRVYRQTWGA